MDSFAKDEMQSVVSEVLNNDSNNIDEVIDNALTKAQNRIEKAMKSTKC